MRDFLYSFESNNRLDMMCMREHIDWSDISNSIERKEVLFWICIFFFITFFPFSHKDFKIPRKGRRITRDIDNLLCTKRQNMWDRIWVEPISWRIKDDRINWWSFFGKVRCKIFDFCLNKFDILDFIALSIPLPISTRRFYQFDRIDFLKIGRKKYSDSPCTSIEIKKYSSFFMDEVNRRSIEFLSSEGIDLEKRFRLNLKSEPKEFCSNRRFSIKENWIPCDDIRSSSVFEKVNRCDILKLPCELIDHFCEKITNRWCRPIETIYGKNQHDSTFLFSSSNDKMSPKTLCRLRIICRKIWRPWKDINYLKNIINLLICQGTVSTVLDAIELSLCMKPKAKFIVNSLTSRDIFSKRKFNFIAISIHLWWWDDRVPCRLFRKILKIVKCFSYLIRFDVELIIISDRQPFCATIHLESFWKRNFYGGLFYYIKLLSFIVWFSSFQHSHIHDASRNTSSWDDHLPAIWSNSESFPREDKFIDRNIFEYFVFGHNKKSG